MFDNDYNKSLNVRVCVCSLNGESMEVVDVYGCVIRTANRNASQKHGIQLKSIQFVMPSRRFCNIFHIPTQFNTASELIMPIKIKYEGASFHCGPKATRERERERKRRFFLL